MRKPLTSSRSSSARCPSTSTSASSPRSACSTRSTSARSAPNQRANVAGVTGPYARRKRRKTSSSACRGSTSSQPPIHLSARANVTFEPWGGPKQRIPALAAGASSSPQPERRRSRAHRPTRLDTSTASSSRVRHCSSSAAAIAASNASIRAGVSSERSSQSGSRHQTRVRVAAVHNGSSCAGTRWSVPRINQLLTRPRRTAISSRTLACVMPSTRAASASSAAPATCAWIPHTSPATSASFALRARRRRPLRASLRACTWSQVSVRTRGR